MFVLNSEIGLYVPSTGKDGQDIPDLEFKDRAIKIGTKFSRLFGGATTIDAYGQWINETGQLIDEKIKIVSSAALQSDLNEHYADLVGYTADLARQWYQDSIAVKVTRSTICPNCRADHAKTTLALIDSDDGQEIGQDIDYRQYARQLADLNIPEDKIQAYWANHYDIQTAVYEEKIGNV